MKPEEALDNINNKILIQGRRNGKYLESEMMKVIIEALEKQVAKKPIICGENPDGTYQFKCPECGRLWWEKSYITKYCDKCGNLIDRSEKDES